MDPMTAFMNAMSIIGQAGATMNPEAGQLANAMSGMAQDIGKTREKEKGAFSMANLLRMAMGEDNEVAMKVDKKGIGLSGLTEAMLDPAQKAATSQGIIPPGMPSMQPGGGAESTIQSSDAVRRILEGTPDPFRLIS